jgi:Putative auto-transporter adhesin, head GIN domain
MKMKKIVVFLVLILVSCEKPSDCVETTGSIITKEFAILPFTKLDVEKGVEVVITDGPTHKLEVKIGENQLDNFSFQQDGATLYVADNTSCNWVRGYGRTIVYITAPNIEEIYSKTEQNISSNGVLTYPTLKVIALDDKGDNRAGAGTGDFYLELNNNRFEILINSMSRHYISGKTDDFQIGIYNGDGRVEAQNFIAKNIGLYHRGSNDIIVFPTESINGKMVSTGNTILKNNPPIIAVEQLYQGVLILN